MKRSEKMDSKNGGGYKVIRSRRKKSTQCRKMSRLVNKTGQELLSGPEANFTCIFIVTIFLLLHLHLPKTPKPDKQGLLEAGPRSVLVFKVAQLLPGRVLVACRCTVYQHTPQPGPISCTSQNHRITEC